MAQNPNWPRLQALWAPGGHVGYGPSAASYELLPWVDITPRLIGPWNINRGRQYELDQVTTGTWSGVLDNRDGLFDPGNFASVVGGNVVPYQPFRIRAQWPITANLLGADQATAGDASALPVFTPGPVCGVTGDYTTPYVDTSASAWSGTRVWSTLINSSVAAGKSPITFGPVPLPADGAAPGTPYTYSLRIRCNTAGINPTVVPFLRWLDISGNTVATTTVAPITLTGAAGAPWVFAGVPSVVPAGAVCAVFGLTLTSTSTGSWFLHADGAQLEQSPSATGFVTPGNWFPLFTGGIERYPQTWQASGTLGTVLAVAVDALALLSQSRLQDPFTAAVFKPIGGPAPTFAYLLADAGGGAFADSTGQRSPAQVGINLLGGGTVTPGTARTSVTPGKSFVCPAGTSVVNFKSLIAGTDNANAGMSFIRVPPAPSGAVGPAAGGFTRMIAFRLTSAPTVNSAVWMASTARDITTNNLSAAGILIGPDLSVSTVLADPGHQGTAATFNLGYADVGNWHLAMVFLSGDGTTWGGALDTTYWSQTASPTYTAFPAGAFRDDVIGAAFWGAYFPDQTQFNFVGDIGLAVEWPGILTRDQAAAIYTAWRSGWTGDTAGYRFGRILTAAGWNGPTDLDHGDTGALSAATDIDGTDAASALQAVTDTEGGVMFADATGNLVFQARSTRWTPAPAALVLGENTAAGEWPYEDSPVLDYDPTLVTNLAEVTQSSTGTISSASDFASQIANGVRDRQVTSQALSVQECQDKAAFLVVRYKIPRVRVAAMTLNPSANPGMWPAVLGLDIGSRAKAVRRPPPPAPPVVVDGFVENIAWAVDVTGDARVTVQISPADPTPYGRFDLAAFDHFVFGY